MRIGILHPGEMGASVGAALGSAGTRVGWASAGRSDASRRRAGEAGVPTTNSIRSGWQSVNGAGRLAPLRRNIAQRRDER